MEEQMDVNVKNKNLVVLLSCTFEQLRGWISKQNHMAGVAASISAASSSFGLSHGMQNTVLAKKLSTVFPQIYYF